MWFSRTKYCLFESWNELSLIACLSWLRLACHCDDEKSCIVEKELPQQFFRNPGLSLTERDFNCWRAFFIKWVVSFGKFVNKVWINLKIYPEYPIVKVLYIGKLLWGSKNNKINNKLFCYSWWSTTVCSIMLKTQNGG